MTDTLQIHDIEDSRTAGYLNISRQLGEIRTFCLADTRPQNLSPHEALQTLQYLLRNVQGVYARCLSVFSAEESGAIEAYLYRLRHTLMEAGTFDDQAFGALLDTIYRESTELRASLGIFRITIPISA